MKKNVCVDLDGTLAQYDGWQGIEHFGEPFDGAVEFVERLSQKYRIVIFTTRCNPQINKRQIEELKALVKGWLDKHGFVYDEIYTGVGKPIAVAYIDDRASWCAPKHYEPAYEDILFELECPDMGSEFEC